MAWQVEKYEIKGTSPLVMHNRDLANPLNEYAKQLKPLTAKRIKTEEVLEEIARLEFLGGLYTNGKNIILPTRIIKKTLLNAAKKNRQQKLAYTSIRCTQDAVLSFPGSRGEYDPKKLWECEQFHYWTLVNVQGRRILRMRPRFHEWSTTLFIYRNTKELQEPTLREWLTIAGTSVGFCEDRPELGGDYGCFELG